MWEPEAGVDADVRVAPAVLRSAAAEIEDLALEIGRAESRLQAGLDEGHTRLAGWQTTAGLTELADRWQKEAKALDVELTALSDGLRRSATNYQDSDASAVDNFGVIR